MLDEVHDLVGAPIRAPGNPTHLMWAKPFARSVTITRKGQILAETINPIRVTELGRDLYGPVIYIPQLDVVASLEKNEEQTFCPLKGHAEYFDLIGPGGGPVAQDIAWTYGAPVAGSEILKGHLSFDVAQVEITEAPI